MARKRKEYDDDDGRVIAPMNVDGMPWYIAAKQEHPEGSGQPAPELSPGEKVAFLGGILRAVLLVSAVFITVFFVVILALYLLMR